MFKTTAKVQVKNAQGAVIASQEYDKIVFEGTELTEGKVTSTAAPDVLLGEAIKFFQELEGKDGNGVVRLLKEATYAYDLGVRAGKRQILVTAAAGPDKAIEKSIKDFMAARAAAGKPVTEEVARTKILALMAE